MDRGTTDAGALVRSLYDAYARRDWAAAAPLLHADALYELPRTGERVTGGAAVLDYQRAYPEPWGELSVLRVISEGEHAAAEISVTGGREGDYRMAALWTVRDGLLWSGVEYWAPLA